MLTIRTIKSLDEAEELWRKLSPTTSIFDVWEFRFCSYKYTRDELFFYTAFDNNEPVALLPLQYTKDKGYLEFFGGIMMDDNRFFYAPGYEYALPELMAAITMPHRLRYMIDDGTNSYTHFLKEMPDSKYVLDLAGYTSALDYIGHVYHGETKKKFIKRLGRVEENTIEIVRSNNSADMELLFSFNIEHFKETSAFNLPYRKEIYRDLLKLFPSSLMTYVVNGVKQAVGFGIMHNKTFYSFSTSVSPSAVLNMASYARIKKIDEAIRLGATCYDALVGDLGWKKSWHFTAVPLYYQE